MKAISAELRGAEPDGTRIMEAFIIADETPSALPTTGDGITGLRDSDKFAPFSLLYVVCNGNVYVANESGTFVKQ